MNGRLSAVSERESGPPFDLSNAAPLWIGFGAQQHFTGRIADLRIYDGALDQPAIDAILNAR